MKKILILFVLTVFSIALKASSIEKRIELKNDVILDLNSEKTDIMADITYIVKCGCGEIPTTLSGTWDDETLALHKRATCCEHCCENCPPETPDVPEP